MSMPGSSKALFAIITTLQTVVLFAYMAKCLYRHFEISHTEFITLVLCM
jgi:hypothetical protein